MNMSALVPRTPKTGGLPNISFIERKSRPLDIEFKTVIDAASGNMVAIDI